MKSFVWFTAIFLFCAGCSLLLLPVDVFPSFYDVQYMGWSELLYAIVIIALSRFLRVEPDMPKALEKNHAVDLLAFGLSFVFLSNAIGDLGLYQLYKLGFEFDKLIHFLTPLISVILIPKILNGRFGIRMPYGIIIALGSILLLGIGWELCEFAADRFLRTHLFGVYGFDINQDTKFDLIANGAGISFGTLFSLLGLYYS